MTSLLGTATAFLLLLFTTGCASRRTQLERVAKDWCETIRASQVIPVYPLTEDLQPGDVFLVLEPIATQADQYEEKGFLPLDLAMTRLFAKYGRVYPENAYGISDESPTPPRHWQFLGEDEASAPAPAPPPTGNGAPDSPKRHREPTNWSRAPRAAFPTYTFSVEQGGGFQAAIPIQSVPIGLSMIRARKATGSVAIADTYTYGVPFEDLEPEVSNWAGKPHMRELLGSIAAANPQRQIYLRVVNRVYLTGSVVVSLTSDESFAGRGDAGAAKDFDIPRLPNAGGEEGENEGGQGTGTAAAYTSALTSIQSAINEAAPGGTVKLAWATNRSVSMSETFDRPLVIGYLGFDFPILAGGELGTPVATRDQLLDKRAGSTKLVRDDYLLMRGAVESLPDEKRDAAYAAAAAALDESFERRFQAARDEGDAASLAFARAKTGWLVGKSPLEEYLRQIGAALRSAYEAERDTR